MFNSRIIDIKDIKTAKEEIRKIGVDSEGMPWLSPKAVHACIKLENVSSYAANILKQEMLGKGGDAAVNRGVVNCSVKSTDVILMGTFSQYKKLIQKLSIQSSTLREISEELKDLIKCFENGKPENFECRKYKLPLGEKTYIMGILNVTPDSFSDGGQFNTIEGAVKWAKAMAAEGADIIDIGGESTRPGHEAVDADEEIKRVVPVIHHLTKEIDIPVSVDTMKAQVAEKALEAGAHIVNDVWGLQRDPMLADVIARSGAGVVVMHNKNEKEYTDLMGDIIKFLRQSISIAEKAGIGRESIAIDPGIGFGKTPQHNLEVMRKLNELNTLNLPVLLGTSRKSFIGHVLDLPVNERIEGVAATVTLGIAGGVDIIRVHDVKEMSRVAKMTDAMMRV